MLKLCYGIADLDFRQLMDVYEETNREYGREVYPDEPENLQVLFSEQDFYQYLELFFQYPGAVYAVWMEQGLYEAAMRLEEYGDGLLITALETLPAARGRGCATELIRAVWSHVQGSAPVPLYSHVHKENKPSLSVHLKCGFSIAEQRAVFVDGTIHDDHYTMCLKKDLR